jgi:heme-degrading monooxygenase HmoA
MHIIIWEFLVREEELLNFVTSYGPHGEWARLFWRADGFLGTELLRSKDEPNKFITIDRWVDAASFERFEDHFGAEYRAMDSRLEGLTLSEIKIGVFAEV